LVSRGVDTTSAPSKSLRGQVTIQAALVVEITLDISTPSLGDIRRVAMAHPAFSEWDLTSLAAARALHKHLVAHDDVCAIEIIRQIADDPPELLIRSGGPTDGLS